jgi:uncharacterized lipoprotein NlpE involved in copper resistance
VHQPSKGSGLRKTGVFHTIIEGTLMNKSILIAAALALAVVGCSDNKQAADAAKAAADKAAAAAKEAADKATTAAKEAGTAAMQSGAAAGDAAKAAGAAAADSMKASAGDAMKSTAPAPAPAPAPADAMKK